MASELVEQLLRDRLVLGTESIDRINDSFTEELGPHAIGGGPSKERVISRGQPISQLSSSRDGLGTKIDRCTIKEVWQNDCLRLRQLHIAPIDVAPSSCIQPSSRRVSHAACAWA